MSVLPYYLAIGMSTNEFWYGEPILAKVYREAHDLRNEMKNQELWVQGFYNFRAFRSVIESFAIGLNGGKGGKPSEYPSEPIPITEREQEAAQKRKMQRTLAWVEQGQPGLH